MGDTKAKKDQAMSEMTSQLPVPNVLGWQALYREGARARCIKDDPPMYGFGRALKVGDVVDVHSVCWSGSFYQISVAAECSFYKLEGYFAVMLPKTEMENG